MTDENLFEGLMGVQVAPSSASMKSLYLVQSGTKNYPGAVEGTIITAAEDEQEREEHGTEVEMIVLGAKQFYTHTLGGQALKDVNGKTRMSWVTSPADGLPNSTMTPEGKVKNNLHNKYVVLLTNKLADGDNEAYSLTLKPGSYKGVADINRALKGKPQQNVVLKLSVYKEFSGDRSFDWQAYRADVVRDSTEEERNAAREVMEGVLVPQLQQNEKPKVIDRHSI